MAFEGAQPREAEAVRREGPVAPLGWTTGYESRR